MSAELEATDDGVRIVAMLQAIQTLQQAQLRVLEVRESSSTEWKRLISGYGNWKTTTRA